MTTRGFTADTIDRFQLGFTGRAGPFEDRLAVPYLTAAGAWYIKYRCLHLDKCECKAKYLYEHGITPHLFNAQTLITAERVVITEGELDAIAVEQIGIAAVAYPGADTWNKHKHWPGCFEDVAEVIVVADGDEAGTKAARTVTESLKNSISAEVRMVSMPPEAKDSNAFLIAYGEWDYLDLLGLE